MSLPNPNNEGTWTDTTSEGYSYIDIPDTQLRIVDISNYVHTNIFNNITIPVGSNDGATARNDQRLSWIRNIIVHYSGGSIGRPGDSPIDGIPNRVIRVCRTIRDRGMNGMAYHFIIPYWENYDNEDLQRKVIYKVQDLKVMGSHTGLQRRSSIGINCPGSFRGYASGTGSYLQDSDGAAPSDFQLGALTELIEYMQDYFSISNLHVQGHFQHGKVVCPGYDLERWIMEHEDDSRRFSYPIKLESAPDHEEAAFLNDNGNDSHGLEYLNSNIELCQGFYPFGRHGLLHNGIHLKSPNNSSAEVYCVHDGWVIAARVVGNVVINGHDYGSPCFVLVQHCDPGILRFGNRDGRTKWNPQASRVEPQRMRHFYFYSLYMHLSPADSHGEEPKWLRMLSEKDEAVYESLTTTSEPFAFGNIALQVKAGEVIGSTGQHNPFALNTRVSSDHNQLKYLLHFEMFSTLNMIAQFDPDENKSSDWSYMYSGNNPVEDSRSLLLENIPGLADERGRIESALLDADTHDPMEIDPGRVPHLDAVLNNLLSKCIVSHISEWAIDWSGAISEMSLTESQTNELRQYYTEFQWLTKIWETPDKKRKFLASTNWLYEWRRIQARSQSVQSAGRGSLGWSTDHRFFFYHPIRFLNWLNGMRRTVIPDGIDYKQNPGDALLPLTNDDLVGNNRNYDWQWSARFDCISDFNSST